MNRRRRSIAVAAAVLALAALAAVLLLRDGQDENGALAVMSARERPFEMPVPRTLGIPGGPQNTGEAFLVAERRGLRFVRLPREDGSSCWGTAEPRTDEWQLTFFTCETTFGRFPDPEAPVLVLARGGFIPGTQFRVYDSFQGLAADGVSHVGVIDERDRLVPMATVNGNAFYGRAPKGRVKAIVALDEEGEVIWRSAPIQLPDE